ncbi:MAG: hypothetical protein JKY95_00420 [Planctomycetaceae bacterium]|nr:hypothetical protein [Planctomycetaceae bacterium]
MKWLSIVLMVNLAFFVESAPVLAQKDAADAVKIASKFLESILKGKKEKRGRKVIDAPAVQQMVRPAGANVAAAKKDIEIRQSRLDAHFAAFAAWVDLTCDLTDEQRVQLNTITKQAIDKSQDAFKKPKPAQNLQNYLYDYSPIHFVGDQGAAGLVRQASLDKQLLEILNDKQKEKWQLASASRNQELHDRFFQHVLQKADKELFLSSKQKEQITNLFPAQLPLLETGAYAFMPQTFYIPQKSIVTILMHPPVAFKKVQMNRLEDLKSSNQNSISFQAMDGLSGWHKKLKLNAELNQEKYHRMLDIRISYIATEFEISPDKKHYLEIAGKGAIVKVIAKWKKSTLSQFKSWEQTIQQNPGQNFGFGVAGIQVSALDKHPLWTHAMEKTISKTEYEKLRNQSQDAIAGCVVAMLDQELWLSADQCNDIQVLLKDAQSTTGIHSSMQSYANELCLVGVSIHGKKRKEIEAILNEAQLNAFVELKSQFMVQNNYLMIKSRHGQMHLMPIPR